MGVEVDLSEEVSSYRGPMGLEGCGGERVGFRLSALVFLGELGLATWWDCGGFLDR